MPATSTFFYLATAVPNRGLSFATYYSTNRIKEICRFAPNDGRRLDRLKTNRG